MLIKSRQASTMLKDAVVLDLGDVARQAAKLRQAAEEQAQQILDQARYEAQQLIDSAEAEGREIGHAAGLKQGLTEGREQGHAEALAATKEQLAQLQNQWQTELQAFEAHHAELDREAHDAVLNLALAVTQKLVHRVIETDRSIVVDQVRSALSHVLRPLDVTVVVHPEDRTVLEEALPELTRGLAYLKHVHLVEDAEVGRGGCRLQHGHGSVDASIDTQLRRIVETLVPGEGAAGPRGLGAEG